MADQTTLIPRGWKETSLEKVVEITSSKRIFADEYKKSGIPFFRGKEISEKFSGNEISTELFISEEKYEDIKNKYGVPEEDDILLTSVGTLGNPYLVEKGLKFYFKDGNLTWFRNYKDIEPKFLFYWIISPQGKETLSYAKIGSTQEAYTIAKLKMLPCVIPSLTEQRAIAAVLSSLDDKIELLREQNKTLEATAHTMFKEWFVNFNFPGATGNMIDSELGEIPEGWRVGRVKDIVAENTRGIAPVYSESGTPVINQRCVRNGTIIEEAIQYHDNSAKQAPAWAYLKPYDILINSMGVGTLGRISQVFLKRQKDYLVHSCITILRANEEIIAPIILGYYFKSIESKIESMGTGTTGQTSLNNSLLGELKLVIPGKKIQEKLSPTFKNIVLKIDSNYLEIQTLSSIRYLLLPKLMKGEIRVEGFND